jgi:hypothetical protein
MNWKNFGQTKNFKFFLFGLGGFIFLLLIFQLGVFVGFNKAKFSFGWGDNYHKTFGGPRDGFLRDFEGKDFAGGHGTPGAIIKIDNNQIIIKDPRGMEKNVSITDKTVIKKGMADLKLGDLKIEDRLVIIGSPRDDGSIDAQLIRIFDPNNMPPPPPDMLKFKGRF